MKRISRSEFSLEVHPVGLIGTILVISSLVMFGNLDEHNFTDTRRLVLAFVFLGIGLVLCAIEALWDRSEDRRRRR